MYRSLISLMPKAQPLLLDLYPNASVAYSLRKLRTAYTGNAIRVRRSSDNAEQDIGFVGNNLDTASLLTFCGVGNGFVTTWYDQSGNARNATQTTAGRQPRIVNGGIIELDNSKSSLRFDGTDDFLLTGNYNFVATDKIYISSVASSETNNSTRVVFAFSDNSTYRSFASAYFQSTGRNAAQFSTDNTNVQTNAYDTYSINQQYLLETLFNTNQALAQNRIQIYRNNNILTFNSNTNSYQANIISNNKPLSIGADGLGNFRHQGKIQEIILYPTDQSTNRSAIETNINTHYNIY